MSKALLIFALLMANISSAQTNVKTETAIFAGGCFWCTEADFDKLPGVLTTTSGYVGGKEVNPTYQLVSAGYTSHTEAVQITFDANKISYSQLVEYFWKTIDPSTKDQQFCDVGKQYRTGIFYLSPEQEKLAKDSKQALEKTKRFRTVHTEISAGNVGTQFYRAEDYHQDYHQKNPLRYYYYRNGCGRDARLKELWK
jgi:peptide-methionine (S)-S-oxide reductase